ncbi:TPA: hypothetical protein ACHU6D_000746 [Streptococcus suis]
MSKQRYGRPSTGQKGNNRPTVVISRESYDEVDNLSIGTGMSRSASVWGCRWRLMCGWCWRRS